MHYLIIIVIIVLIVYFQIKIYRETKKKLLVFKNIFASKNDDYNLKKTGIIASIKNGKWKEHKEMLRSWNLDISNFEYSAIDKEGKNITYYHKDQVINLLIGNVELNERGIQSKHSNPIYNEIQTSINNYLSVNKSGVSDFHLMKDIVDRNNDAHEEEITTQIPIPLYLGLVGTMAGILVGIGFLVFGGGLNDLLGTEPSNFVSFLKDLFNVKETKNGIETLMGGVALAMISSILGILLTTFGSIRAKNAKSEVEKNKHIFLSWIQAELLPTLSNDTSATLEKMSQNLLAFNNTFSTNTNELGKALSQVNESYRLQTQLFDTVKQLAEKDISVKTMELYNVLKNSTKEIGTLAIYLNNVNDYLANVKALNEKLDTSEKRTKSIEDMATFFKAEVQQIETRKGMINKAVGTIDSVLQEALSKLKDHANDQLEELKKTTSKQFEFLQKNSEHINAIVTELKNLTAVKESILKFEQATRSQNTKLDNLANAIYTLANAKTEGTTTPIPFQPPMPSKKSVLFWTSFGVVGLVLIFIVIANWNYFANFLNVVISLFRI